MRSRMTGSLDPHLREVAGFARFRHPAFRTRTRTRTRTALALAPHRTAPHCTARAHAHAHAHAHARAHAHASESSPRTTVILRAVAGSTRAGRCQMGDRGSGDCAQDDRIVDPATARRMTGLWILRLRAG